MPRRKTPAKRSYRDRPPVNNDDTTDDENDEGYGLTDALDKTLVAAGSAIAGAGAVQVLRQDKDLERLNLKRNLAAASERVKAAEARANRSEAVASVAHAQSIRTLGDMERDLAMERWKARMGTGIVAGGLGLAGGVGIARLVQKWDNMKDQEGLFRKVRVYFWA